MKRISEYSSIVEEAVRALVFPAGNLDSLYAPVKYGLEAGGKRLRPVMLLMGAEAFGGPGAIAGSIDAAVGYETFHNFTLLHDDVMDHSDMRRGRPSVPARWDENTAIISGDTMLTLATEKVAMVPDSLLRKVLDTFNRMAIEVYEGQRLDMDFEIREEISPEEYIEMISKKTGALMAAAVKTGALIGGASDEDAELMYRFGSMLGIAFQMEDDWLDTFGDTATFGKPIGGDIRNRKKTYLVVSALREGGQDADAFRAAFALENPDLRVKTVTRVMEHMGLPAKVRADISACTSKAMAALKATSLGEEQKEAFRKLVEKLASRKK